MSYFGVSLRNGVGLGLGTVPSLTNTPLSYRLAPSLDLSFAGSDALSPAITFSRTTNATLTNSAGLVANAPMNLLTFSEQFDNAAWGKTASTVSANTVVAPNGTTTADSFLETATTDYHSISTSPTMALSTKYTFSIYAKPNGRNWLVMNIYTGTASTRTWFDVSNGVVGTVGAGATAVISSAGNGWYRCSITVDTASSGSPNLAIWTATADNNFLHAGDITKGLYIWGAQLELGSTATTYNPTTVKNLLGFTENFDNAAWTKSNAFVQTNLLTYSQDFDNAAWSKSNTTVTANGATAPDGSATADSLLETAATAIHNVTVTGGFTASLSTSYAVSIYVKANGRDKVRFGIFGGSPFPYIAANFNLTAVTATASPEGTGTVSSATITPVGSDWYRLTVVGVLGGAGATTSNVFINTQDASGNNSFAGDITKGVFIWGAQLVQGATPGDYKATYAAAAAVGYTDIYGQPFAQKLVENSINATHIAQSGSVSVIAGTAYTMTIYAKAAERSWIAIQMNGTPFDAFAYFNLASGVAGTSGGSPSSTSITSVGNGWYRLSITKTAVSSGSASLVSYLSPSDGGAAYTGDGTSGIYIFGAQLSDSASVDPYVYQPVAAPSSVAYYGPRFDYDPVTLAPKGLLIEEQRTNLVLQSDGGTGWGVNGTATVTSDTGTAPNGTNTAFTLTNATDVVVPSGGNNVFKTFSVSPSTAITLSLYVKAITATTVSLNIYDGATGSSSSQAIALTSGWQRVQVTRTSGAATTAMRFTIGAANGTVLCWGAQAEAGAFATSYIPTVASQVTRAADSASMIGNNFARWYNVNTGTLFAAAQFVGRPATVGNSRIVVINDNTTNNIISAGLRNNASANNMYAGQIVTSGTTQALLPNPPAADVGNNVTFKSAIAYATDNIASSQNGSVADIDTSAVIPLVNRMSIGSLDGTSNFTNGTISRIAYYNRRLSNTELQGITA